MVVDVYFGHLMTYIQHSKLAFIIGEHPRNNFASNICFIKTGRQTSAFRSVKCELSTQNLFNR